MPQRTIDLAATNEGAISLRRLCQPRQSVFDRAKADTVANIGDFNAGRTDADTFFGENHVTEGMKVLLRQVFERLSGHSDQGVFRPVAHQPGAGAACRHADDRGLQQL